MPERRSFGRLRKRPSGRWQAAYVGPDKEVHTAPETFSAKGDAEAWLNSERVMIERDEWTAPDKRRRAKFDKGMTLDDYAPGWLATHRKIKDDAPLKDRTREHYGNLLDSRILPHLGDLPMHLLTEDLVRDWLHALPATPVANAHAYALLSEILKRAAKKDKRIQPVVIPGATRAKTTHKAEPATLPQLATIVENMHPRFRLAILLMSWCALRFGEVTELRVKDINVTGGKIHVRRAVVLVEKERRVTTPKSDAGERAVSIPPHLLPTVVAHLDTYTDRKNPEALLFPSASGGHLSQSTLNGKPSRRRSIKGRMVNESATGFCRAREAAGRPDLRLHDLRHTGAVLAAQTGATIAELMARLGHSTPAAAMRYQHAAEDRDREIAAKLSMMVEGVTA